MITTKEQELKALSQIKKIVSDLGEDSYIAAAFEGCFEIAEDNIGNDFACSMKQRAEKAEKDAQYFHELSDHFSHELDNARDEIGRLRKEVEKEQEWQDYELKDNVRQSDYDHLSKQSDTKFLSDDEAKTKLYDWFGFAKEKVVIHRSIPTYQINRHGQLRKTGTVDRRPAYSSTDWNYIRFDCGMMSYELKDGEIRFFYS